MRIILTGACLSLLTISLPGCVGVPNLYAPSKAADGTVTNEIAPKVYDIVRQITCELYHASNAHLSEKNYVIQAQLTLQVDDEIYFQPSLSAITPLSVADESRTLSQNLSIGGSRQRTFASTFYYESDGLRAQAAAAPSPDDPAGMPPFNRHACTENGNKLYSLDGNLGLSDIARDGVGIDKFQQGMQLKPGSQPVTFGSQIKFVVTRAAGIGPLWTLTRFKGPSGSNGLFNGKALATDSLIIAFSEKEEPTLSKADKEIIALLRQIRDSSAQRAKDAEAKAQDQTTDLNKFLKSMKGGPGLYQNRTLRSLQAEADIANKARDAAIAAQEDAQRKLDEAKLDALTRAKAQSDRNAMEANQSLINTIIFQNLNTQPN